MLSLSLGFMTYRCKDPYKIMFILTSCSYCSTTAVLTSSCEKVASDLGLSYRFPRLLQFTPPSYTDLSQLEDNSTVNKT